MGKIVVNENVSLDGVMEDPTGEDGFKHGGWFLQISDRDREEWAKSGLDQARVAAAFLMGRRSDAYFAPRWLSREGEWADRLNSVQKYVVSSTLERPLWTNSTLVKGDVIEEVAKLRREIDGEIVVIASRQLAQALMEHDLVDELRLTVYPFVLGSGQRLFGEMSDKRSLRLLDTRKLGDSLTHLTYEVVRDA